MCLRQTTIKNLPELNDMGHANDVLELDIVWVMMAQGLCAKRCQIHKKHNHKTALKLHAHSVLYALKLTTLTRS